MKSKHVMVIAPHPDDETLGVGGTMLKLKKQGVKISWVIVTSMTTESGYNEKQIAKRQLEIDKVSKAYGLKQVIMMDYSTGAMHQVDTPSLVNDFRTLLEQLKPDTIFIPNRCDIHTDHRVITEAVLGASKPFRCPWVKNIYMYETISETDLAPAFPENAFIPQMFVDITGQLDQKIKIMKMFAGEMGKPPFPRSEENIRALAHVRGSSAGMHFAESFMVLRQLMS